MPENTTRVVGTFQCADDHEFELIQKPIQQAPCTEEGCRNTARRTRTVLEPLTIISTASVRLAIENATKFLNGSVAPMPATGALVADLRDKLAALLTIAEGNRREPAPGEEEPLPTPADKLARLRVDGWMVVCHNDYRKDGGRMTFWSFANGPHYIKGEGRTDDAALTECERAAAFVKRTHV